MRRDPLMRPVPGGILTAFVVTLVAITLCSVVVTSCGNDATVTHRDRSGAEKINMPDKFATIADKCDGHGGRVYESRSGVTARIDPTCPGGRPPTR